MMSKLGPVRPIYQIGIVLAIVGQGTGTFVSPNKSAIMGAAPLKRQGIAAGLLATARSTGMVLGIGLAGAIFTTLLGDNAVYVAVSASLLAAAGFAAVGAFCSAIKK